MTDPWMSRITSTFFLFATFSASIFFADTRNSWAAQAEIFDVHGIKVDVTAVSTAAARDQALAIGERVAFRELLERLTIRVDHPRLPNFSANEISAFIRDFEVAKEKASTVRYLATLNYSFKADDVRSLLIDQQIAFAETTSKPVLILPVYKLRVLYCCGMILIPGAMLGLSAQRNFLWYRLFSPKEIYRILL